MTAPRLDLYLSRIGYAGRVAPDAATLAALHRHHLAAIPFENLDVQLGRKTARGVDAVFDKLVTGKRGGWCYEQNTLFGWALGEIGFRVTRTCGGVMRAAMGDQQLGNHLCLLVDLDGRTHLADVGFGGSLAEPIPLAVQAVRQDPFAVGLSQVGGGYWRYTEQGAGDPFSFDFAAAPADEALFEARRAFLETDPSSPFVQNVVAQVRRGDTHITLRGKVVTTTTREGQTRGFLKDAAAFDAILKDTFGLDVPEAVNLWPTILERHAAIFPAGA